MNLDYSYCEGRKCIHKQVCKRWIGGYNPKEVEEAYKSNRLKRINEDDCINGKDEEWGVNMSIYLPYWLLDRKDKK